MTSVIKTETGHIKMAKTNKIEQRPQLLTATQVMTFLNVSPAGFYRLKRLGRLPEGILVGRAKRYLEADVVSALMLDKSEPEIDSDVQSSTVKSKGEIQ